MRSAIPTVLFVLALCYESYARPANRMQCFGCPAHDGYGRENYIQEMHPDALVCFYSGSSTSCMYDEESGEMWANSPASCPLMAEITYCLPDRGTAHNENGGQMNPQGAGGAYGSIMALMKEKTGGRLTTQERIGQGRLLAERLGGGRRY
ncbi:hypothetical protein CALVIDRAFT_542370 [Calocera viscosa TUFC12733]|uniref:Uncharacterized protein n=1 Tax=Calocera viscosa (strain TUFC12733) TaxID=1330018 RepID=A0A167GQY7_CALVF|nr:hypothetical protein CALVIDRAFT_542370 [Calocera viscosa TUFC12733]